MANISSEEIPFSHEEIQFELLKSPVFVYAGRFGDEQSRHFPLHKHDKITEVLYIANGESSFIIDSGSYSARPGNLVIFNCGVFHEEFYQSDKEIEAYYCGISNLHIHGLKDLWLTPENIPPVLDSGSEQQRFYALFQELYNEGCDRYPGYNYICNNLVSNLSVLIIRILNARIRILNSYSHVNTPYILANRIKGYIDANMAHSITISDMAAEFHLNASYLSHVFKKFHSISPIKYHEIRRMDEAKRLLSSTEMTVREIAFSIGYENINHFYQPFKKHTGVTPNAYRHMLKKDIRQF
jgi:AraC-like DNA-binding protein/mannose-6-phosphate isomerase-like protein (cupin superfamily)